VQCVGWTANRSDQPSLSGHLSGWFIRVSDVKRQCNYSIGRGANMTRCRGMLAWSLILITACAQRGDGDASTEGPEATSSAGEYAPTTDSLEQRDLPVDQKDLDILVRANALLADTSAWNRADDRVCDDDESTGRRSLFCVLQAATISVLGTYDHRRVALQEVRFAVEDATAGREFEHRLMEFNNLPETTIEDVRSVLLVATDRVRARLEAGPKQP
jgi:hypothetical protein